MSKQGTSLKADFTQLGVNGPKVAVSPKPTPRDPKGTNYAAQLAAAQKKTTSTATKSTSTTTSAGGGGTLTSTQQSAYDLLNNVLTQAGLSALSSQVKSLILNGTLSSSSSADDLQMYLGDTAEWKARFAGNEALKAKGLQPLSAADYLSVESQYAQIMKNYGLPEGFYDSRSEMANLIGNSVSVNELQTRVSAFADVANRDDPGTKAQLRALGMTDGDLLAYTIDATKAMPLIQQKLQQITLGAAARNAGVTPDANYLTQLASQGITEQQAQQGFSTVASDGANLTKLGDIYGEKYGIGDLESEVFEDNGTAANKRKRLASQERASFTGSSGIQSGSLAQNTTGSF